MNLDVTGRASKHDREHRADLRHSRGNSIFVSLQIEILTCSDPKMDTGIFRSIADVCKVALLAFYIVCVECLRQYGQGPQALTSGVEIKDRILPCSHTVAW